MSLSYEEALAALNNYPRREWRLGLDRMAAFCERLGLAGRLGETGSPAFVHIAGTNGKGTTTAFAQSLLVSQGYRTGAAYSPYVYDVRERVQLDRDLISREHFGEWVGRLLQVAESMENDPMGAPTEFEFKTALGFAYWNAQACDAVALEVGLGGRLDATNVVTPACSVIVSIGMDHMEYLGDTLAKIATEKAGIIKPGRPVVVGPMADEAREAIELIAQERGSEIWQFGREIELRPEPAGWTVRTPSGEVSGLQPRLKGAMTPTNMSLAVSALYAGGLRHDEEALREGVRLATIPGRFEERTIDGQRWVLDGAHNAPAAAALAAGLMQKGYREVNLVTGMLTGHDPEHFAETLAPCVRQVLAAPIDWPRTQPAAEVAEAWENLGRPVTICESVAEAVRRAQAAAGDVVATGSFYLLSEVDAALRAE
jgi:dihydrofolate synthase/folylpolyglutamate synthase